MGCAAQYGFLRTLDHKLYRSNDKGLTWNKADQITDCDKIFVSKAANRLFVLSHVGDHWTSTDMGGSYKKTMLKGLKNVKKHPTESNWLIGTVTEGAKSTAMVSQDFGNAWRKVDENVIDVEWGMLRDLEKSKQTVYYIKTDQGPNGVTRRLYRSKDLGKKDDMMLEHVIKVYREDKYLFAMVLAGDNQKLVVCTDGQHFQDVHVPLLPSDAELRILDSSEGAVFLHTSIDEAIYVSGPNGTHFTKSIENVKCLSQHCDFHKMKGVDGVYFANSRRENGIISYISFNKGASWQRLRAPMYDSKRNKVSCVGKCSLHLHGVSTNMMSRVYSSPAATGLVMASGNIGDQLDRNHHQVNMYVSRDAGLNWQEAAQGSHAFDMGDHGALMVMVPFKASTTSLLYSWNEGLQWKKFEFTDKPMSVMNVFTHEAGYSQVFFVYGVQSGKKNGVIAQLDFETFHKRACKGLDKAGTADSDYALWSPSSAIRRNSCLLGKNTTYTRRKPDRRCYNSVTHRRQQSTTYCKCAESDFECDYGYKPKGGNFRTSTDPLECERDGSVTIEPCSTPKYSKSSGYRRIAGDECTGNFRLDPVETDCKTAGSAKAPAAKTEKGKVFDVLSELDSPITDFKWVQTSDGLIDRVGYIRTSTGTVYWTKNRGVSWTKVDYIKHTVKILQSKEDLSGVFIMGATEHYIGNEEGPTSVRKSPRPLQRVVFHPSRGGTLLAVTKGDSKVRPRFYGGQLSAVCFDETCFGWRGLIREFCSRMSVVANIF